MSPNLPEQYEDRNFVPGYEVAVHECMEAKTESVYFWAHLKTVLSELNRLRLLEQEIKEREAAHANPKDR